VTTRRAALALAAAGLGLPALGLPAPADAAPAASPFAELERRSGARIGLAAVDTGSGKRLAWRADERFPMCSTFKALAVSAVLRRVDAGEERLDREVVVDKAAVVGWAPVTGKRIGGALPLASLCEAAVEVSDNGAANLILDALGGPSAVTAFARSIGDPVTRLDRRETALNAAMPGDPRDTTTPAAMMADLEALLLGATLLPPSRNRLIGWMLGCKTGEGRLQAGLPAGWKIAQKTGSGGHGSTNDIGLLWPPGRAPLVVALYTTGSPAKGDALLTPLAETGRILARSL
jgi:beta-lactamase class A